MVVNLFAPSQATLQEEVDHLKAQVRIARARTEQTNVCPVNIDCQRRLRALLENNWVMENDSLRTRIIELERVITSRGSCTDIIAEDCNRSKKKIADEHEEQKRRLEA